MPEGIYVAEVSQGSPAEQAGLKKGYIITALNGKETKTMEQLQEKLQQCKAGEQGSITVKVSDNGGYREKKLSVTFGKKPSTSK